MRTQFWASGTFVLCAVALSACAGNGDELSVNESALCAPVDSIDSLPDGKDEDCDGKVDENVDYRPQNCPVGSKVIQGTRGDDIIHGTSKADCILGYGGNDTIYGEAGNDTIFGGPGNDKIYTGAGVDTVKAGKGADTVDAAGCGVATLYGEDGADTLHGGKGIDTFFGGNGNDIVVGGNGADIMQGGDCNDLLIGDDGIDVALGNNGFDACGCETITLCEKKTSQITDCDSNADCAANEICASNVQFCVPKTNANMACNECVPTAMNDVTCNGVDDDCDGLKDEDFVATATSCGQGACAATGTNTCVNGATVNSCVMGTPAANDSSCDGIDNNCNGSVDEEYVATPTSCGSGACAAMGLLGCMAGHTVDTCEVTCEGACSDSTDDDEDGAVDCADSDCSASPSCVVVPPHTDIGKSCTTDADCSSLGAGGICDTSFPGGYCFVSCDIGNPAGECPAGSFCWLGASCLLPCGPGDTCENPNHECSGLEALGLPPDPFCRPTCDLSCPTGLTCDPTFVLCI